MSNPNLPRVIADVNELLRPPAATYISATALEVQVAREMAEHQRYGQSMPSRDELQCLAARTILTARGVIAPGD